MERSAAWAVAAASALLVAASLGCSDGGSGASKAPAGEPTGFRERVSVAALAVLRAIDDRDAKAFAALSAPAPAGAPPRDAAVVEAQLVGLHEKYGARPHRVSAVTSEGGRWSVATLFGDAEDLAWLVFENVAGEPRLASVSAGDPAAFVEPPKR